MVERREQHARPSLAATAVDGTVTRVSTCEHCPAWTREPLDPAAEVAWADTWLAGTARPS